MYLPRAGAISKKELARRAHTPSAKVLFLSACLPEFCRQHPPCTYFVLQLRNMVNDPQYQRMRRADRCAQIRLCAASQRGGCSAPRDADATPQPPNLWVSARIADSLSHFKVTAEAIQPVCNALRNLVRRCPFLQQRSPDSPPLSRGLGCSPGLPQGALRLSLRSASGCRAVPMRNAQLTAG